MINATLYDLIFKTTIDKWRKEAEQCDDCGFAKTMLCEKNIICNELSEDQRILLNRYRLSIENYYDYIYFRINLKLLSLGIKLGMELQKSFDEEAEK